MLAGTLDGKGYFKQAEEKMLPAMVKAAKQLKLKKIKLQDDNAPVHAWAWMDPEKDWQKSYNHKDRTGQDLETKAKALKITRCHQPARSPDLNAFGSVCLARSGGGSAQEAPQDLGGAVWEALQEAWRDDLTEAKIECAFRLLKPVMACIKNDNGGNAFKLPHSGIRKEMRDDGWDI